MVFKRIKILFGVLMLALWSSFLLLGYFVDDVFYIFAIFLSLFVFFILIGLMESFLDIERIQKFKRMFFRKAKIFLAVLLLCVAVVIAVIQVYFFLREGGWYECSIVTLLSNFSVDWAHSPNDWKGLWVVFDNLPITFILIISAGYLFYRGDSEY